MLNVSGTISWAGAPGWTERRKWAEYWHSSRLLPGSESVCDPLPHAPVAMASPPGWTILSTKVTKRFLPYEALSGIGYSDGKSN